MCRQRSCKQVSLNHTLTQQHLHVNLRKFKQGSFVSKPASMNLHIDLSGEHRCVDSGHVSKPTCIIYFQPETAALAGSNAEQCSCAGPPHRLLTVLTIKEFLEGSFCHAHPGLKKIQGLYINPSLRGQMFYSKHNLNIQSIKSSINNRRYEISDILRRLLLFLMFQHILINILGQDYIMSCSSFCVSCALVDAKL